MNRKQQRQRRHRLLSSTQLLHIPESFHGWHRMVLNPRIVRLLRVLQTQVRDAAHRRGLALREVLVHAVDAPPDHWLLQLKHALPSTDAVPPDSSRPPPSSPLPTPPQPTHPGHSFSNMRFQVLFLSFLPALGLASSAGQLLQQRNDDPNCRCVSLVLHIHGVPSTDSRYFF